MSPWVRGALILMLLGICGLEGLIRVSRDARATLILDGPPALAELSPLPMDDAAQQVLSSPEGAEVLTHLTHDDIARGIWALSQLSEAHPLALSPAQRSALQGPLKAGAHLRLNLETQRDEARRSRRQMVQAYHRVYRGLDMDTVAAIGKERAP